MDNEKSGRSYYGAKCKSGSLLESEPHNQGEQEGYDCIEPHPLAVEIAFSAETILFRLQEQPVKKEEDEKCSSSDQENRC
jgi:hypothetical protein